ncbi:HAMP domain-containing sensor histidine kinase [Ruminococcus sp. HUN007]|uniref:sensor histidine kinase n=1 Tax=Ruminococcus sp. HUN007 TaxID=1514668 RepID=UPI0005D25629|nr:HAMP domain-containing sensor histidine kinase [Ruminococcus sp. HUN007]
MSYLLLVGLSLALLWGTQILFLNRFYENERINIAEKAADTMTEQFSQSEKLTPDNISDLTDIYDEIASSNELSYMLVDRDYRIIHENSKGIAHQFSRNEIDFLQTSANLKGGKYTTSAEGTAQDTKVVIICRILKNDNTDQGCYLIVNTLITPVKTTIYMLRKTTYLVTILMILISVIAALIMSKSLAKPIQNITESADKLAKGEYKTEFRGGKFAETKQLARTLNYASSEISKIDELQRDLIANVSHDLRTPLTMIKAYAEMIRDLSGDRKEKREEHLAIIIKETDRLAQLVNDILDLSKLENGRQPLNISSFDISSKLHDIMERYKEFTMANGYTIHCEDHPPVIVKCDIGKIEQVIYNLVNNAINYTGEDKQIYVSMETEDEFVKISIKDTGKGISEDNLHQIFEKYYRAEKTKREVVGTGLGLSIVRAVLKAHNFPFGVQSTPGKGTTFWFKIRRDKESICI